MADYTKITDFAEKDTLGSGNPDKIIKGAEFEVEFDRISTAIATKADTAGPTFTGTATFATTNATTVQIGGTAITSTAAELNTLDGITSTTAELNTLDGFTGTVDDLNYAKDLRASGVTAAEFDILDGLTADATELNILDGATVTTAELNTLSGVTSTAAELNILDGVTADATELNLLDGVTATTTELNLLAGVTATTDELNYVDGVTSAIQTQLDAKAPTASPTLTGTVTAADLIVTNRQVATDDASGINIDGNDVTIRGGASTGTGAGGSVLFQASPAGVAGNLVNTFSTVMTLDESGIDVAGAVEFDSLSGTGSVSITDILDEDDMTSDSATALATQQSIKAYVDTTVAATNEVVEDTTPQLGGDLDTNGNDINFGDNDKAVFGAGSDLEILSQGTDALIRNGNATAEIRIESDDRVVIADRGFNEAFAVFNDDDDVKLYHDGSQKLATTSTGIDVTGTVTADGLTVEGTNGNFEVATTGNSVSMTRAGNNFITASNAAGDLYLGAGGSSFIKIDNGGDISFYEDTGTTAKLFWDASAERLGIGTSSPAHTLQAVDTSAGATTYAVVTDNSGASGTTVAGLGFANGGALKSSITAAVYGNDYMTFNVGGSGTTERMRIDSSGDMIMKGGRIKVRESDDGNDAVVITRDADEGYVNLYSSGSQTVEIRGNGNSYFNGGNVGIGTNTPGRNLEIAGTGSDVGLNIVKNTVGTVRFAYDSTGPYILDEDSNPFRIYTGGSERVRIDSSGNVGLGTSSPDTLLNLESAAPTVRLAPTTQNNSSSLELGVLNAGTTAYAKIDVTNSSTYDTNMRFFTNTSTSTTQVERMRITSGGDVGIGVTSIGSAGLSILNSMNFNISEGANSSFVNIFRQSSSGATVVANGYKYTDTANKMASSYASSWAKSAMALNYGKVIFYTDSATTTAVGTDVTPTERMRLDSSGNLMVGKSASSLSTVGAEIKSNGLVRATADGTTPLQINRLTSNGILFDMRQAGNQVGTIQVSNGDHIVIGGDEGGQICAVRFYTTTTPALRPASTSGANRDNLIDLGASSARWKDVYLGGQVKGGNGTAALPSYSFSSDVNTGMFRPAADTLGFSTNGAEDMRLTSGGDLHVDGNVIAYSTTISDRRLKSDITNISNALDKVGQINGVTFVRDHNGEKAAGVVAQEIMEVLPEAVKSQALPLQTGEQDQEYYVVEYDAVTGLLVEAVKELKARVEALEAQ